MIWTDVESIALALYEAHPNVEPSTIRFDVLRQMVESLEDFEAEPDKRVNEQILEAIQAEWIEEFNDAGGASGDDDEEGDGPTYTPNNPFR